MWDVRRGMWEMGRGMSDVEGRGVASNWAGVFKAPFTGSCGALASSPPTPLREVEIRRSAPSVSLRSTAPPLGARERAGRSWARQRPLTPFAARRDLSPRGGERGLQDNDPSSEPRSLCDILSPRGKEMEGGGVGRGGAGAGAGGKWRVLLGVLQLPSTGRYPKSSLPPGLSLRPPPDLTDGWTPLSSALAWWAEPARRRRLPL